jgi:hypothetical protein
MLISQDLLQQILLAGAILAAILALLKTLADLYKFLNPFLGPIVFWGSILVPHGLIIWYWMYLAAINSNRIREGQVFIWLIIQLTLLTSIYTFIWSKWFYPKLNLWLKSQSHNTQSSNAQGEHEQKRDEIPPSDISE